MPKPCSLDLRLRLLEAVIAGASRREAAECMDVSSSSAVKWLQRWQETGSVAAKPTGGSISPLEEHADWLLALIAKQPDLNKAKVANRSSVFLGIVDRPYHPRRGCGRGDCSR